MYLPEIPAPTTMTEDRAGDSMNEFVERERGERKVMYCVVLMIEAKEAGVGLYSFCPCPCVWDLAIIIRYVFLTT